MEIYIEKNYNDVSKRASDIITTLLKKRPTAILGLSTGSTPLKLYNNLVGKFKKKEISFKKIKTFNLDEYLSLSPTDENSYRYFMWKNLFSKIDIDVKNTFFPTDFKPNYKNYDKKIKLFGGIDLQILGIGRNGHIAFNEPNAKFSSRTREIFLAKTTIEYNARFFKDTESVPKKAVTMGIKTIMEARQIILIINGENKSKIVYDALFGSVSTKVPASILQRHKNVIVILDKMAAQDFKK